MAKPVFTSTMAIKYRWNTLSPLDENLVKGFKNNYIKYKDDDWYITLSDTRPLPVSFIDDKDNIGLPNHRKMSAIGKQTIYDNTIAAGKGTYTDGMYIAHYLEESYYNKNGYNWYSYGGNSSASQIKFIQLSVYEVCTGYKCTRCNVILANKSSSHKNTAKCKVIDERKELEAAGYTKFWVYRQEGKSILEFGYKTDSMNQIWIPSYIKAAHDQYITLCNQNSDIVKKAGKNSSFISAKDWINRVAGATTNGLVITCAVTGCGKISSTMQPSIKQSAITYSYCEDHGSKILDMVNTFNGVDQPPKES